MRLSENVENFMRHNTPGWSQHFIQGRDFDNTIYKPSRCIMGELYDMSDVYERNQAKECVDCSDFGGVISRTALNYQTYKDHDNIEMTNHLAKSMNTIMRMVIDHVKAKHPELLKQERALEI